MQRTSACPDGNGRYAMTTARRACLPALLGLIGVVVPMRKLVTLHSAGAIIVSWLMLAVTTFAPTMAASSQCPRRSSGSVLWRSSFGRRRKAATYGSV